MTNRTPFRLTGMARKQKRHRTPSSATDCDPLCLVTRDTKDFSCADVDEAILWQAIAVQFPLIVAELAPDETEER